jgi:hypothetical protein
MVSSGLLRRENLKSYKRLLNIGNTFALNKHDLLSQTSQLIKHMDCIVNKKNGVVWDVTPCGFCKNRRFGGT